MLTQVPWCHMVSLGLNEFKPSWKFHCAQLFPQIIGGNFGKREVSLPLFTFVIQGNYSWNTGCLFVGAPQINSHSKIEQKINLQFIILQMYWMIMIAGDDNLVFMFSEWWPLYKIIFTFPEVAAIKKTHLKLIESWTWWLLFCNFRCFSFSGKKFVPNCHWSLLLKVQLTICRHTFR